MVYNINFSGRDVNGRPFHDNVDVTDGNESIRNAVTLSQLLSNLQMNRARYYYDENLKVSHSSSSGQFSFAAQLQGQ